MERHVTHGPKMFICTGGPLGQLELAAVGEQEAVSAYRKKHTDVGKTLAQCLVRKPSEAKWHRYRLPEAQR